MKKINLLTTGLATTCTETIKIRNIDYSWLINNPSILLWADNIFLTKYMEDSIFNEDTPFDKSLKLIIEILNDYDIIKFKNSKNIFNDSVSEKLDRVIEEDLLVLENNKDLIKIEGICDEDYRNLSIGDKTYCFPELKSIYASLLISEKWNANCLFSDRSLYYLNYKMNNSINREFQSTLNSFEDIFKLHLPDIDLMPRHVFSNDGNTCKWDSECVHPSLNQIKDNLMNYLDIRSYDEINQIKDMVYKINKNLNSKNQFVDSESIIKEYKNQRNQIRKSMHTTFPKVKKWTSYSMVALSSIAGLGFLTGSNLLTGIGFGADFLGAVFSAGLNRVENKNKWVSFKVENIFK